MEELKYPHLVSPVPCVAMAVVAIVKIITDNLIERRQKCLYPWLSREICALACERGGYAAVGGRYEEG